MGGGIFSVPEHIASKFSTVITVITLVISRMNSVEVQWSPGTWVAARVTRSNADQTFDVQMQKGRSWFSVAARDIRPMQAASYESVKYTNAQQPISATDLHSSLRQPVHAEPVSQVRGHHLPQFQLQPAANLAPMQANGPNNLKKGR